MVKWLGLLPTVQKSVGCVLFVPTGASLWGVVRTISRFEYSMFPTLSFGRDVELRSQANFLSGITV